MEKEYRMSAARAQELQEELNYLKTTRSDEEIKSGAFPKEVSLHSYEARTPSDHFPVVVRLEF